MHINNDDIKIILITGVAGFIGYHVAERLLSLGYVVIGCDNMNNYYDVSLKRYRCSLLRKNKNFIFYQYDITHKERINALFERYSIDVVCHLASMVGVRHSMQNKEIHYRSNILGFRTVVESAKQHNVSLFVYASSSSVYGDSIQIPFSEKDSLGQSMSYYAETKKENERIASEISGINPMRHIGLRFFTVYGPLMRPDMALFLFIQNILENKEITLFGDGLLERDFTYIDDVVDMVTKSIQSNTESGIFNVGTGVTTSLQEIITLLEKHTGVKALCVSDKKPDADMQVTCACTQKSLHVFGYSPKVSIEEGIIKLITWYRLYYGK